MKYRAEIDGLRALAVLPVILFHAGFEWFSGGFVGVDIFFVISGYLITTIIISEMAEDKFSIVNFYERRARRILPALFFVMIMCLPFAILWLAPSDLKDFGQSLISTATFSSNILFWWERGYFGTAIEFKPLLHTWSLAVEEQYYIFFPIFLLLSWKLGIKKLLLLLIIIFLISLSLAHIASVYGVFDRIITGSFYLIPTRAWELLIGVFIAFYFKYFQVNIPQIANQILSLIGFGMIIFSIVFFDKETPFPSLYTLIPTIGTALLIVSAKPNTIMHRFLSIKYVVFIGLISYSAYLWHQPMFAFTKHRFSNEISDFLIIFLCLSSLFLAYISWRWIEKPFRKKNKITQKGIFNFSIAGIMTFIFLGSILSFNDGFLKNYSKTEQVIYNEFLNLGLWNPKKMSQVNLKDFDHNDKRKKLLVIGDSYAEDLINAVNESDLKLRYQLSSYRMPSNCGVLYVNQALIEKFQPPSCDIAPNFYVEKNYYDKNEKIEKQKIQMLIQNADEVWVESAWMNWQISYMKESLNNLKELNPNIVLFGSKEFEIKSASQFKNQYGLKGLIKDFPISENHINLSDQLKQIAEKVDVKYVDPMFVICDSYEICKHSYDGNGIISADSGHLTPYGANYFGTKLEKFIFLD